MNIWVFITILGILIQAGGVVGYISTTRLIEKREHTVIDSQIIDNETGQVLQSRPHDTAWVREYKLVKRSMVKGGD